MITFGEFTKYVLHEQLHPDLKAIISGKAPSTKKMQTQIADTIKSITSRGEDTGIARNTPKGSSRLYIPIQEPHRINLDGVPASVASGMKVAIKSPMDAYHNRQEHDGYSLGELQNRVEDGDYYSRSRYHVLTKNEDGSFTSNKEDGIFPPRFDSDPHGYVWSHIGHADNLTASSFRKTTVTPDFPKGISHDQFSEALTVEWNKDHGKHWPMTDEGEEDHKKLLDHPLIQRFLNHQREYYSPPHDYRSIKNLGLFQHPDGTSHIVARDHGYNGDVQKAYKNAHRAWAEAANKKRGY